MVVPLVRTPLATARATTTPAIRAKIAASEDPAAVLAGRYGVSIGKTWGWLHILPYPPYRFTKSGLRFSAKARIPSF